MPSTIDALEHETERFLESLNGLSGDELVALLPRVRRIIERLDEQLPLILPGDEQP